MTGWAQIHGWRGETDTVEKIMQRVKHDLYYIENWSLTLDFKILLLTVLAVLRRRPVDVKPLGIPVGGEVDEFGLGHRV